MVSLDRIREEMKKRLKIDNEIHNVEVNAPTIDEALADASVQLETKTTNLEFEVIEKGSDGFLGLGKKPWKLRIYQNPDTIVKSKANKARSGEDGFEEEAEEVIQSRDGLFYVRHFGDNIVLKVLPPVGEGRPIEERDVMDQIKRSDTKSSDDALIKKLIAEGTNETYIEVGTYAHVPQGDSTMACDISKDEMHGTIVVDPPSMSGADLTPEQIKQAFETQGVLAGIDDAKIMEFIDNPVYGSPYEICSAILPEDGKDSYLEYLFETDVSKLKAHAEEGGNVDFKEQNRIQNVVKGQPLAKNILATRGKGGKTLFGRYLEAKNGKDIPVQLGSNVEFDQDGVTIIASENGQVLLINGKISVEPVLNLDAVNIKSGNVNFLGTVIIKGAVEDGFDVKASGDIDIGGTIGKCNIEAGNNLIIHQGVFGKNEGSLKAGKSMWVKFVQEMKIEVEENLIATDSLMNCEITAMKNIVVYGKKAQITGGKLFATEEICSRTLGSPGGGTTTTVTVGIDPRAKKRLDSLLEDQGNLMKELENLDMDITTLENLKKARRNLPPDKEQTYHKLINRKSEIINENRELTHEIEGLQEHLRELKSVGKVKVEGTTYPGTKIYVRDVLDEVQTEVTGCTFYYEDAFARRGKYEAPSIDVTAGPEGYS